MDIEPSEIIIQPGTSEPGTTFTTNASLREDGREWELVFVVGGELLEVLRGAADSNRTVEVAITAREGYRRGTGRITQIDTRHRGGRARIIIRGIKALELSS